MESEFHFEEMGMDNVMTVTHLKAESIQEIKPPELNLMQKYLNWSGIIEAQTEPKYSSTSRVRVTNNSLKPGDVLLLIHNEEAYRVMTALYITADETEYTILQANPSYKKSTISVGDELAFICNAYTEAT